MANPTITSNGGGLLLGVNLAGAEFGTPNHVPGVFGTDYIYPTHTEIDYYAAKGMSVVRLPFLWERLQHSENGPLDGAELARDRAAERGRQAADGHSHGARRRHRVGIHSREHHRGPTATTCCTSSTTTAPIP
jgi:hypothetical protein